MLKRTDLILVKLSLSKVQNTREFLSIWWEEFFNTLNASSYKALRSVTNILCRVHADKGWDHRYTPITLTQWIENNQHVYLIDYKDGSQIGVEGIRKFVGRNWPALKALKLGKSITIFAQIPIVLVMKELKCCLANFPVKWKCCSFVIL